MSLWKIPPARKRWPRITAVVAAVAGLLVGLVALAPAAFAHHSDITGSATCDQVVSWTATAWAGDSGAGYEASRTNPDVDVWYTIGAGPKMPVATGAFNKANGYSFNGTFAWPNTSATTLRLWVQEKTNWANGTNPSSPRSWDVSLPIDCVGSLSISKVVTGDGAPPGATYTIGYDNGSGTSGQVAIKGGETKTVSNLPFGSYTLNEVNPPAGDSVSISPNPAVIAKKGDKVDVTVTNAFIDLGGFSVTKHVTGETAGYVAGSAFTVGYSCSNQVTGSLSLKDGETKAVSGLPVGTTCSLNETAKPATVDASYVFGSESFTPSSSVTIAKNTSGNTVAVTLNNPITRVVGGFTVTKHVTGETAGYVAGSTFTVGYSCDNGSSGSLTMTDGQTKGVSGLPVGTSCTLNETGKPATVDASYVFGSESWVPSSSVTIVANKADNTVAVTLNNPITRVVGGFTVTKHVTGETAGYVAGSTFTVGYDCSNGMTGSLSLKDGETKAVSGLPVGTTCSLNETAKPATKDASYVFGSESFTPSNKVTIGADSTVAVSLTNPIVRVLGGFTVTKHVTGETAGYVTGSTFTVDYDCSNGVTGSLSLKDSETKAVSGLPVGTTCSLDETAKPATKDASYVFGSESFTPSSSVTIEKNTAQNVVAVNLDNPIVRVLGGFSVTKHVTGETAGYVAGSTFTVGYSCDNGSSGSLIVKDGQTKSIGALPAGTSCTLSETAKPATVDASYVFGSESFAPSNKVTIGADSTVAVSLTNPIVRVLGGFTVTKHVTGETAGYVAGSTFTVGYSCDNGSSGSLTMTDGQTKGASGLPVGTSCTLNETAKPATSGPSYAYGTPTWDPSNVVTIVTNDSDNVVAASLKNPIKRLYGSLEVSKAISGATDGYVAASAFGFNVDCDGTDHDQALSLEAGGSSTIDGIPLGTNCKVTETSVPDPVDGYEYGSPTITPADGVVTITSTTAAATVAFDNPLVWLPKPGATVENACDSGGAVVTLTNDGGGEVAFTITVDGAPVGSPVTVGSESTKDVVVPLTEDQVATIEVTADGFGSITKTEVTHNCQEPAAAIVVECGRGGVVVTLTNDGPTQVDLTVTKDGEVVKTVTVGTEPVEVLVSMTEDEQAKIEVLDGTTVVGSLDATYNCEPPPTSPPTTPAPTTPAVPTQVLGTTQTPGSLPRTGFDPSRLVFGGLALILGGGALLVITRRRRA